MTTIISSTAKSNHQQKPQTTDLINLVFTNDENKDQYLKAVLGWLQADYEQLGEPVGHFWHNRSIIANVFEECKAMVALNSEQEVIGYMIWSNYNPISIEIDIVEVKENYRRQGIMKKMLNSFLERFPETCVLTGSVIPQSEEVFNNFGFVKKERKHFKIVKPHLTASHTLPDGPVIAVCSDNFYAVNQNPEKYKDKMQYFKIQLDNNGKLLEPIITDYHYEGYIGIYLNQSLVTSGKAKHLFNNDGCFTSMGTALFVLTKISPLKPEPFSEFLATGNTPVATYQDRTALDDAFTHVQFGFEEYLKDEALPNPAFTDTLLFSGRNQVVKYDFEDELEIADIQEVATKKRTNDSELEKPGSAKKL